MNLAEQVFEKAFEPGRGREGKSEAFRAGVLQCLLARLEGHKLNCPYQTGSVEYDAFYAGVAEGRELSPIEEDPLKQFES